jgi:hypothetical protein
MKSLNAKTQRRKDAKKNKLLVFGSWFLAFSSIPEFNGFTEKPFLKNQSSLFAPLRLCAFALTLLPFRFYSALSTQHLVSYGN